MVSLYSHYTAVISMHLLLAHRHEHATVRIDVFEACTTRNSLSFGYRLKSVAPRPASVFVIISDITLAASVGIRYRRVNRTLLKCCGFMISLDLGLITRSA
jgi:hypothetical protein